MYYKPDADAQFLNHSEIRSAFSNVSFPAVLTDEILNSVGIWPLAVVSSGATYRQNATAGTPVQIGGVWTQTWTLSDATQDEIDDRLADKWTSVRATRNKLLAASDWTQIADAPLADAARYAWAEYRQQLRDITTQADPFNITWPQEPQT